MKQENRVGELQKNLISNLEENAIEDGNTDLTSQGVIYTSEINETDYYEYAYEALVTQVIPDKNRTGTDNVYRFILKYEIENSTTAAVYGKNLIKSGDPFTIINDNSIYDFNYIKGSVLSINEVNETGTFPIEIIYDLTCSITEGNPANLALSGGQIFKNNRRIYTEEAYVMPTNLYSTYSYEDNKIYFYWDDISQLAVSYRLQLRSENNLNKYIYEVNGNGLEFTGKLTPLLFTANGNYPSNILTTLKIEDPGNYMSFNKYEPTFLTTGAPPIAYVYTNNCGQIEITDWVILDVISYTDYTLELLIQNNGIEVKTELASANGGLRNLQYVSIDGIENDFIVNSVTPTGNFYTLELLSKNELTYINLNSALFNLYKKEMQIHTGIYITNPGSNLTKPPVISYEKYPVNSRYYVINGFTPGTYYWSVCSLYDCDKKIYSEWSPEEMLIIK